MLTSRSGIDFNSLFSRFDLASRSAVIAAVSGGSDSTALLLLLKDHIDGAAPGTRLVAVTVDHRLRPGSADEALSVARLCALRRIEHRILSWTGRKPGSGLPAAAREARHDLLAGAAGAERTDLVLTAHTADDQAETVVMRQARDEGRGMAGMADATLFCGRIWFGRPLLQVRRQLLRAFLEEGGIAWADDPSNADEAYERPRIREALGREGGERRVEAALATSRIAAAHRTLAGERAARLIRDHATQVSPGLLRLDPRFAAAGDASVYGLRILLAVTGGSSQLPDAGRAAALVERLAAGGAFRAVLSRSLVDSRRSGIFLLREARGLPDVPYQDGMIWDGRFRIEGSGEGLRIRSAGSRAAGDAGDAGPGAPASLVRAALAARPVAGGGEAVPITPVLGPWLRYLPSFDFAPARAAAALIGAADIPEPPFAGHNGSDA